jgi:hypothetical protein
VCVFATAYHIGRDIDKIKCMYGIYTYEQMGGGGGV